MAISANKLPATAGVNPGSRTKPRRGERAGYLFILPALLIVGAVSFYPILYEIWLSFNDWYLLQSRVPEFAGLAGYQRLLADGVFWQSLGRTALWTVGTVVLEFVVALPVALLLNRRTRITGLLTGVLLLPWVTPAIVAAYTWRWLLDSQFGTVHFVLRQLGIVGERSMLADPSQALWGLIIMSAWKGIPFMAIGLLAAMKAIPGDLYEAAAVDGANYWRQFTDLTLPLLKQTSVILCLILGILAFYSFDMVWIITKGGPGDSTLLLGIYLFRLFFERLELSYAATIGTAMLALLIVFSLIYLRVLGRSRTDA